MWHAPTTWTSIITRKKRKKRRKKNKYLQGAVIGLTPREKNNKSFVKIAIARERRRREWKRKTSRLFIRENVQRKYRRALRQWCQSPFSPHIGKPLKNYPSRIVSRFSHKYALSINTTNAERKRNRRVFALDARLEEDDNRSSPLRWRFDTRVRDLHFDPTTRGQRAAIPETT